MKLRVTNRQKYVLGRRGFVFPPGETTEIEVNSAIAHHEIAASRYLTVEVVDESASGSDESATLNDLTVEELRAKLESYGIDVPSRARKDELVTLVAEAQSVDQQGNGDGTDDSGDDEEGSGSGDGEDEETDE